MKDPIKESLDKIRLIESQQINEEYSKGFVSQLAKDAHAAGSGLIHGVTGGFDDHAFAGIDTLTGLQPDYKTALQNQMANTANIKAKASGTNFKDPIFKKDWNPDVYDAGHVIGSAFLPFKYTKFGGFEKKMPAMIGGDWASNALNKLSAGISQDEVDALARMSPEEIKKQQAKLGVAQTGKVDLATVKAMAASKVAKENLIKDSDELILDEALQELNSKLFQNFDEKEIREGALDFFRKIRGMWGKSL